ncbi:MAG: nicotinamide-nucleotide amidohydrolase family protein [Synergistaceae bacterium]|jgi:PncC family amidohydrolase|nr:nicotinamide-nucleotide amidohydrolase family protein [Synergistaceae bacterium]
MNRRTAFDLRRAAAEALSAALRVRESSPLACGNIFTFAESCTGGLLASSAASVSGVSGVFPGSVVTYSDKAKIELLSVVPETIERYGAVSAQCAAEMARGALDLFGAFVAVSVTGIAGPGGGSPEKPVGTVWFAVAHADGRIRLKRGYYPGRNRRAVRERAAFSALVMLIGGLRYEIERLAAP